MMLPFDGARLRRPISVRAAQGRDDHGDVHHLLPSVVYLTTGPRTTEALSRAAGQSAGTAFPVEGRNRPLLVTFTNHNSPDTLAAAFDHGYALKPSLGSGCCC